MATDDLDTMGFTPLDSSYNIRRRPLSIFSRRGIDSPVPTSPTRSRSVSMYSSPSTATQQKSKPWKLGRTSREIRRSSGTILRAVPENGSPTAQHTTQLELEMQTSPNEEILSAIGQTRPASGAAAFPLPEAVSFAPGVLPSSPTWFKRSRKTAELKANFIGVWRDGKVQWESDACILPVTAASATDLCGARASASIVARPSTSDSRASKALRVLGIEEDMARSHLTASPATEAASGKRVAQSGQKPRIRVTIPQDRLQRAFSYSRFGLQRGGTVHDVSPTSDSATDAVVHPTTVSPVLTYMPRPQRSYELSGGLISPELREIEGWRRAPVPFSNSSSSSHTDGEDQSNYSNRTSMTSVDAPTEGTGYLRPGGSPKRTASKAFSITSPVVAGVFDENTTGAGPHQPTSRIDTQIRRPPAAKLEAAAVYANMTAPPIVHVPRTGEAQSVASKSSAAASAIHRSKPSRYLRNLARLQTQNRSSNDLGSKPLPPSPTLSEAEKELEAHLTTITEDAPWQWDDAGVPVQRTKSVRAPSIPARNTRRRNTYAQGTVLVADAQAEDTSESRAYREMSSASTEVTRSGGTLSARPVYRRSWMVLEEIDPAAQLMERSPERHKRSVQTQRNISAEAAEAVILQIMESLEGLEDLFATALLNKGFYRVFKHHELRLMKSALRKMSPAAWEFRERSPPNEGQSDPENDAPAPEYTPATYLRHHTRDTYIINALKVLILERCQSFLRAETAGALAASDPAHCQRIDDAFWRIWTFCKIFGGGRGREDDIVAQMDWLRGGALAHQQTCTSSMLTSDSFYVSDVLLSAPEHFAGGNAGGLSAEQLYDMTEVWTCLGVLIQGVEGKTELAREHGVFDMTDVRGGDIDGEEAMLEEWHHHLLTLGLSPLLTLAHPSTLPTASAFHLARAHGWTAWTPPASRGSSRAPFLKDALSRVYEERIAATFDAGAARGHALLLRRQRAESMQAEIRERRRGGERLRLVRMSQERPMSGWEGVVLPATAAEEEEEGEPQPEPEPEPERQGAQAVHAAPARARASTACSSRSTASSSSSSSPSAAASCADTLVSPPSPDAKRASSPSSSGRASVPSMSISLPPPSAPPSPPPPPPAAPSQRPAAAAQPPLAQHPALRRQSGERTAATQHPLQLALLATDDPARSADRAVYRLVEMGFTPERARMALKVTDMGGGLDVGRAVELLLRS